jgi:hypothetical protein
MSGRLPILILIIISRVARFIRKFLSLIEMHSLSLEAMGDYTSDASLVEPLDVMFCCIDIDAVIG